MATGILSNTITDPSGTAIVGATINARLKPWGGFRADATEVARLESTTTDSNGTWSLTLEENANITPAGTYWEIEEQIPEESGGPVTWAVRVSGNSSLQAALISELPTYSTGTYLTQAAADARYQALGSFAGGPQIVNTSTAAGTSTAAMRGDAQFALSTNVAGVALHLGSGVLDVGLEAGVYAVGTNSLAVRIQAPFTATASIALVTGYRVPWSGQTATATIVTPLEGDLWTRPDLDTLNVATSPSAWAQIGPLSGWTTFSPTLHQPNTLTVTTSTVSYGRYMRIGRLIRGDIFLVGAQAGTNGQIIVVGSLPVPARVAGSTSLVNTVDSPQVAWGTYVDSGTALYSITGHLMAVDRISFVEANTVSGAELGSTPGLGVAINDTLRIRFEYEALT